MKRRRSLIREKKRRLKDGEGDKASLAGLPEWVQLRTKLLEALEAYPEAKQAVVKALAEEL